MAACNTSGNQQPVVQDSSPQKTTAVATPAHTDAADAVSTDSAVSLIRTAFEAINKARLTTKQFEWEANGCGGGTATYYFNQKGEIVKVQETGSIGDGVWTTDYYYQGGKFIFSYNNDTGGPAMGPDVTTISRRYVYGDKVIRTGTDDAYTNVEIPEVLTAKSKEYRILQAYKTRDFGGAFCD